MLKTNSKKYLENAKNYVLASILAHEDGKNDKEKFDSLVNNIRACLDGENKQRRAVGMPILNIFSFSGVRYFVQHDGCTFTPWTSEQVKALAAIEAENKDEYKKLVEKYSSYNSDAILYNFSIAITTGLKATAIYNFNYNFIINMHDVIVEEK